MKSKNHVKNISISDEAHDRVLFEGDLGELIELSLVEGDVLEIVGVNGILRVGIKIEQLQKIKKGLSSELGSYKNTKKRRRKKYE